MKTRLAIWLGAEFILAVVFGTGSCLLRRDEVGAFRAWRDHANAETRAELDRQRRITYQHQLAFAGILWSIMAGITVPIVVTVSRRGSRPERSGTAKECPGIRR